MAEAYEIAVRLGHVALRQQYATGLAETADHSGHADQSLGGDRHDRGVEELGPFFEAAFAAVRSLNAGFRGDLEEATAQGARASQASTSLQSAMVSAAKNQLKGQLAFFHGDWAEPPPPSGRSPRPRTATSISRGRSGRLSRRLRATSAMSCEPRSRSAGNLRFRAG